MSNFNYNRLFVSEAQVFPWTWLMFAHGIKDLLSVQELPDLKNIRITHTQSLAAIECCAGCPSEGNADADVPCR
jgi:hypothetical protein